MSCGQGFKGTPLLPARRLTSITATASLLTAGAWFLGLLTALEKQPRDRAIIEALYGTGARVEELYREIRPLRIYEGATDVLKLIVAQSILPPTPR